MSKFEPYDNLLRLTDGGVSDLSGIAVTFSAGIRKIRHLEQFLGVDEVVSPFQASRSTRPISCVLVWGRKQNSFRALRYAKRNQLPVFFIEDGWIRSSSADPHSRVSYSLLVDDTGVYYDSTVPSSLEQYLNLDDELFEASCGADELAYAADCRRLMVEHNITKYNYCRLPDNAQMTVDERPIVLVLDQTLDDASVRYGAMDAESFEAMLVRAVDENPDARVIVRTHPDVVKGRKVGYLHEKARKLGIEISADADNPIPWLKKSSVVYVGTSQLGYEALLCGCSVKVAGQPFYAGWGLTDDWQPVTRRIRHRCLDQLFHATHVQHARYCCPVTGQKWALSDCLEHVLVQQTYFRRNAGKRLCIGITPWKRRYIAQFLRSPYGQLRFSRYDDAVADEARIFWSFTDSENQLKPIEQQNIPTSDDLSHSDRCFRAEDGFIRSKGLGSDFAAPASLVFDDLGLYFDASRVSALEQLLNTYQCTEEDLERAKIVREKIVSNQLTKYNVGLIPEIEARSSPIRDGKKSILVVGQVEGDQSVLRGSSTIFSNSALLTKVREANPDAFIVFKPHPDVVSGNRKGAVAPELLKRNADLVESSKNFIACLNECDELHTLTSLSGFEALLRNKQVVTYGMPFYAGWGVTRDTLTCNRRRVNRTVDELVFICLVLYPHYVDLTSGEFVTVEQLINKFDTEQGEDGQYFNSRLYDKISNVYKALTY